MHVERTTLDGDASRLDPVTPMWYSFFGGDDAASECSRLRFGAQREERCATPSPSRAHAPTRQPSAKESKNTGGHAAGQKDHLRPKTYVAHGQGFLWRLSFHVKRLARGVNENIHILER